MSQSLKIFLHPVRDVDHRNSALFELAEQREEVFALTQRQGAGWLVHDDHAGSRAQGSSDLYELFLSGGELADAHICVQIGADLVQHLAGALSHFATIDPSGSSREITQAQVFGDRHVWAEG